MIKISNYTRTTFFLAVGLFLLMSSGGLAKEKPGMDGFEACLREQYQQSKNKNIRTSSVLRNFFHDTYSRREYLTLMNHFEIPPVVVMEMLKKYPHKQICLLLMQYVGQFLGGRSNSFEQIATKFEKNNQPSGEARNSSPASDVSKNSKGEDEAKGKSGAEGKDSGTTGSSDGKSSGDKASGSGGSESGKGASAKGDSGSGSGDSVAGGDSPSDDGILGAHPRGLVRAYLEHLKETTADKLDKIKSTIRTVLEKNPTADLPHPDAPDFHEKMMLLAEKFGFIRDDEKRALPGTTSFTSLSRFGIKIASIPPSSSASEDISTFPTPESDVFTASSGKDGGVAPASFSESPMVDSGREHGLDHADTVAGDAGAGGREIARGHGDGK